MLDIPITTIRVPDNARLTTCCINGVGCILIVARQLERRTVDLRFTTAHIEPLQELLDQLKDARKTQLADNARKAEAIEDRTHSHIDVKG